MFHGKKITMAVSVIPLFVYVSFMVWTAYGIFAYNDVEATMIIGLFSIPSSYLEAILVGSHINDYRLDAVMMILFGIVQYTIVAIVVFRFLIKQQGAGCRRRDGK